MLGADDVLLCFGRMESMRDMVPQKAQKRRQKKATQLDPTSPVIEEFSHKHHQDDDDDSSNK